MYKVYKNETTYKASSSGTQRIYVKTTTFTSSGTYTCDGNGTFEITIKGGGGGSANAAWSAGSGFNWWHASGGKGGLVTGTTTLSADSYPVVVGSGGVGKNSSAIYPYASTCTGNSGGNSSFAGNIAKGGGGGYCYIASGVTTTTAGAKGGTTVVSSGLVGTSGGGASGGGSGQDGSKGSVVITQTSPFYIPDYDYYIESGIYYGVKS